MHTDSLHQWQHDHTFGLDRVQGGERRTWIVVVITLLTMVVEIAAGLAFGSMALLADGLHMGSHAVALGIAGFAYLFMRRRAGDARFSFGTGKMNALGGFTGAVLLAGFAAVMAWESVSRLVVPVPIRFEPAIAVAVVGLLVNALCFLVLGGHAHGGHGHHHRHDHNLRSATLHVLADALTSLLAIFALLAGRYLGAAWLDPVMGIVGALLVARWSAGLLRQSGAVLLDCEGPAELREDVRATIEGIADSRISDLHVWSIGPALYAAEISLVTHEPYSAEIYKRRLAHRPELVHVTVEVQHCVPGPGASAGKA